MIRKFVRATLLAALLSSAAGVAHATEGWYSRVDVGYSTDGALETDSGDLDFDDNWSGHLGGGYGFQNGFRLEGELGYRNNDFEDLDGEASATSLMANLFYDFHRNGRIRPYIGVGVGAAKVEAEGVAGPISFDDDDTVVAYQGLIGVAFDVTERLDLDVGYRYFTAPDVGVSGIFDSEGEEPFSFEGDYEHQAITVGLRYNYAPPPAPVVQQPTPQPQPQPQPVACPTSEFVVYFEWDRSNLNAAALETIDAAIQRARECNIASIVLVGHTDTSGSNTYNQGLSERRAAVVRDALVARGIGASAIASEARGESDLARATPNGVREPLNRRTAVTISFR